MPVVFEHSKVSIFKFGTSPGTAMDGLDSVQFSQSADPVDVTGIGDAAKSYISGIGDSNISISGTVDVQVTGASAILWAAFDNGGEYDWGYIPAGAAGAIEYRGSGIVTEYSESSSVGDKVTFSAEILVTTAITRGALAT